jgi:tetratricopeptide (TPR) repeat protein
MYYFIGDCYKRSRQYKNAEIAFRKYSELNPENDCPRYSIGIALMKQGLHKESIGYFEMALELDEEYSSYVYCLYAYALFKAGITKKAQIAFDKIIEEDYFSDGFYYYYPQFLWAIDKHEEAFEILENGIKEHPVYPDLFYIKAMFYYRMNDRKTGNKFLNTALKLGFDDHYVLFEYAPELEKDKEILEVIEAYRMKHSKGKS